MTEHGADCKGQVSYYSDVSTWSARASDRLDSFTFEVCSVVECGACGERLALAALAVSLGERVAEAGVDVESFVVSLRKAHSKVSGSLR